MPAFHHRDASVHQPLSSGILLSNPKSSGSVIIRRSSELRVAVQSFRAAIAFRIVVLLLLFIFIAHAAHGQVKLLSINEVSELIRSGVSPNRIAQLVEEHGVNFELDEQTSRKLRRDGASDTVVAALNKASGRYHEQRQHQKEEEVRRARDEAERKRQEIDRQKQEVVRRRTDESNRKLEQERQRAKEEAEKTTAEQNRRKGDQVKQKSEDARINAEKGKRQSQREKLIEESRRQELRQRELEELQKRQLEEQPRKVK